MKKDRQAQAADPKTVRQQLVADTRRELILQAARSAFFELGLDGTSLREIAKRAGYTPGALYSYFDSKEAVYAALLSESLDRLNATVESALEGLNTDQPPKQLATNRLKRAATGFFSFYADNPQDLDLGFYLFHGMQPRGLTPTFNMHLNASLKAALKPVELALLELGMSDIQALTETTSLFAHIAGILVLTHTGRIRMFKQSPEHLFECYMEGLLGRIPKRSRTIKKVTS